jgi:hypothetical protein
VANVELNVDATRLPDLGLLIRALAEHCATVTINSRPPPGRTTVHVYLPDDDYRDGACRQAIVEWQSAGGAAQ